jgi:glycosyltransferase involved in cell wall biosynthesis
MCIRALIVTPSYPAPDYPEAAIFVHRQVMNLMRQGVQCRVLQYRPEPPRFPLWLVRRSWVNYYLRRLGWPDELEGVPIKQVFFRRLWSQGEDVVPAIGEALVRYIESHPEHADTDVVYAHWLWTAGAAALALRDCFGWPVVAIARGSEMHDWHSTQPHCRRHVERVLREADRVLANCENLRDRAEELVPGSAAGIGLVYNGCDAEVFRPAIDKAKVRRALKLETSSKLLLFCGDLIERKGVSELIESWRQFIPAHPEWQLVMVGRAVDSSLVARLKEAGNGRVLFIGPVTQRKVISYMQAADAYIQPSRLEGLANATMEAMATGLPVITTDTCGQRELIRNGENGWLVPPGDVEAIGQALDAMSKNFDMAQRFGQEARRTIETRFNPQKEAAGLADILKKTASQGQRKTESKGMAGGVEASL